jgi:hypothetical protein
VLHSTTSAAIAHDALGLKNSDCRLALIKRGIDDIGDAQPAREMHLARRRVPEFVVE